MNGIVYRGLFLLLLLLIILLLVMISALGRWWVQGGLLGPDIVSCPQRKIKMKEEKLRHFSGGTGRGVAIKIKLDVHKLAMESQSGPVPSGESALQGLLIEDTRSVRSFCCHSLIQIVSRSPWNY